MFHQPFRPFTTSHIIALIIGVCLLTASTIGNSIVFSIGAFVYIVAVACLFIGAGLQNTHVPATRLPASAVIISFFLLLIPAPLLMDSLPVDPYLFIGGVILLTPSATEIGKSLAFTRIGQSNFFVGK